MKKKRMYVTIIAAVAIAASWNFSQNEVELSDLALANVEALARGEGGGLPWGNHKLVYKPTACCDPNPMHECSGVYTTCN